MARTGSGKVKTCISLSSLVGYELADGCEGAAADGRLQPTPGLNLPQARHFAEAAEVGAGSSNCWGDRNMVDSHQFDRDERCIQSRNERRQYCFWIRSGSSSSILYWRLWQGDGRRTESGHSTTASTWQCFKHVPKIFASR